MPQTLGTVQLMETTAECLKPNMVKSVVSQLVLMGNVSLL